MTTIRAIICDDEEPAREILAEFLGAHEQFEIVARCANGLEAIKAAAAHDPDVLFLDIQMPKIDGFEVLELLDKKPCVVFVTAYDEYALKAFEVHAADYLLKPYTPERFAQVIAHVEEIIRSGRGEGVRRAGAAASAARRPLQRIAFRDEGSIDVVPIHRVDYIEAHDDYVHVHAQGKKHIKQQTLAELERLLDSSRFVRVHRSYLVNLDSLARVEPYAKDSRVAVLKDGTRIPVSRTGYDRLRELL